MKIQKKNLGGVRGWGRGGREGEGWGVRVDVIEEFKFFGKFTKKNSGGSIFLFGGGGGGRVGGSRWM